MGAGTAALHSGHPMHIRTAEPLPDSESNAYLGQKCRQQAGDG